MLMFFFRFSRNFDNLYNWSSVIYKCLNHAEIHWRNFGQVAENPISIRLSQPKWILPAAMLWIKYKSLMETLSEKLHSKLRVTKHVNYVLSERLVSMKRQCWANSQNSLRECLELVGAVCSASDDNLEKKV